MTICIAGLFRWNYAGEKGGQDWGPAALLVSDRMITAGDSQYEPLQQKIAQITPYTTILIAGDYSTHSQALINTAQQVSHHAPRPPTR